MIISNIKLGEKVFIHPTAVFNNVEIGSNTKIAKDCTLLGSQENMVKVGHDSIIAMHTVLDATMAEVSIGAHASIGQHCVIVSNWGVSPVSKLKKMFKADAAPITIGDHTWIGSGCVIAPGVTIGKCSIVASNSYVDEDVPEYSIYGGNPAKLIRKIAPEEIDQK